MIKRSRTRLGDSPGGRKKSVVTRPTYISHLSPLSRKKRRSDSYVTSARIVRLCRSLGQRWGGWPSDLSNRGHLYHRDPSRPSYTRSRMHEWEQQLNHAGQRPMRSLFLSLPCSLPHLPRAGCVQPRGCQVPHHQVCTSTKSLARPDGLSQRRERMAEATKRPADPHAGVKVPATGFHE